MRLLLFLKSGEVEGDIQLTTILLKNISVSPSRINGKKDMHGIQRLDCRQLTG